MALKFWLGEERSDKSNKMLQTIVEEAERNSDKEYLVIVPEQFTLATQKKLVMMSSQLGILNIDVLSFMRFAHRISDEVGTKQSVETILDDCGKNLILQLLAQEHKDELTIFGDKVDKLGYVTKIKSIISEFMQYGINPDKVADLADLTNKAGKQVLASKLQDTAILYKAFIQFINDKYTTTEEILDQVASIIAYSDTVKKSVIVFDGFTGFTPVQLKLIGKLLDYSLDIHVALLLDEKKSDIFDMSKKTIDRLEKMAVERLVQIAPYYENYHNTKSPKLIISENQNIEIELKTVSSQIEKLIRDEGYRYKDIAILTGDIEGYRHEVERVMDEANIPYFIDRTQPLLLNPFVEYIRALISIYTDNYSYESIFRFLKSGIVDIEREEIAKLENYCLATGVKGYKSWHTTFNKPTDQAVGEELLAMEDVRKRVISLVDDFSVNIGWNKTAEKIFSKSERVIDYVLALYKCIEKNSIEKVLSEMSCSFMSEGDLVRAEEYKLVYVRIMNVMEELAELIPEEIIDIATFARLLDSGFDEIRIGVAPNTMDYVQVGDLIRSRIGEVKALFIVGANDGVIPMETGSSGVINEKERRFLTENGENIELAPTSREDAYNQRLYLYMAVNKPEKRLYVSYIKVSASGKSLTPSYIIRQMKRDYEDVELIYNDNIGLSEIYSEETAFKNMCSLLQRVSDSSINEADMNDVKELVAYFMNNKEYADRTEKILKSLSRGELSNGNDSIGAAIARTLYGNNLVGSVTRLETYANCAYQYFLKYGIKLKEREVFSFEARDLGNIFHDSISIYSGLMEQKNIDWFSVSKEDMEKLMAEAVDETLKKHEDSALASTARMKYMQKRITRIMQRTATVISDQIKKGEFTPRYFEVEFSDIRCNNATNIRVSADSKMKLVGRIDRIDTCKNNGDTFVKIVDYKSSAKELNLADVYDGKQLQLMVYLNAAVENEEASSKNVIPAGVFYYHIDDPIIQGSKGTSDDEISQEVMKKLRLNGLVNSDENGKYIDLIDSKLDEGSTVLHVSRTQKGIRASKQVVSGDDFSVLSEYTKLKIKEIGKGILEGDISIPKEDGNEHLSEPNCQYCDFKAVCANAGSVSASMDDEDDSRTGAFTNDEIIGKMREKLSK